MRTAPDGGSAVGLWGPEFDDGTSVCDRCGEMIPQEDVSVEAFEEFDGLVCTHCAESLMEARVDDAKAGIY